MVDDIDRLKRQLAQVRIQAVLADFDFSKVRTAMEALEWEWADGDNGHYIPKEADLECAARRLLSVAFLEGGYHFSGGLMTWFVDDVLGLSFVLEESTNEIEEEG